MSRTSYLFTILLKEPKISAATWYLNNIIPVPEFSPLLSEPATRPGGPGGLE